MWIRRLSEVAVCLAIGLGAVGTSMAAPGDPGDPLSEYRERFKQGMDRFQVGAYTEAIGFWEPLYGELGEQKGYRLAYNLAVAFEELGDATRAAEHLEAFLTRVDTRRAAEEALEPIVLKEESDAKARLASLSAVKARVRVDPGNPPRPVQVDAMPPRLSIFVAWVSPGRHTVTFSPGTLTAETKRVDARAGELIDVEPPPPAPPPTPVVAPHPVPPPVEPPIASPPQVREEAVHPFSEALLYVSGGLAITAVLVSIPLESSAWSLRTQDSTQTNISPSERATFDTTRTSAYAAIGAAVGLGVLTAALTSWYFLDTKKREVVVGPGFVSGSFP